jgi:cell division protein FtsZ
MPQVKPDIETFAKIKVIGIGGGGGSAVDRMAQAGIRGVEFLAFNTDVQALHHNSAQKKLHIGKTVTRGLGAGMNPEMGKRSAEESQNEIREALKDTDMVFITCGLGGGTGSGASPMVAQIARELGALTVAVVTKPFSFEGPQRKAIAERAHEEISKYVDTIITIPNDRILQVIDKKTSLLDAFQIVDDVLRHGVQGISELITVPGLINVDFADVRTIMSDKGTALMGIGIGSGENRIVDAAEQAISSPLLDLSVDGASGILYTITGGKGIGMQEVAEASKIITGSASDNASIIFGTVLDESLGEDVRITVVATGFGKNDSRNVISDFVSSKISSETESSNHKTVYRPQNLFNKKKFRLPGDNFREDTVEDETDVDMGVDISQTSKPSFISKAMARKPRSVQEPASHRPIFRQEEIDDDEEDLEIPAFIRKKMNSN